MQEMTRLAESTGAINVLDSSNNGLMMARCGFDMDRTLCHHWNPVESCAKCGQEPTIFEDLLELLEQYGWTSYEQTSKELICELEQRVLDRNKNRGD